jgi:hypothetical protein
MLISRLSGSKTEEIPPGLLSWPESLSQNLEEILELGTKPRPITQSVSGRSTITEGTFNLARPAMAILFRSPITPTLRPRPRSTFLDQTAQALETGKETRLGWPGPQEALQKLQATFRSSHISIKKE